MAKTLREIPFESIEKRFKLAGYRWGPTWCPAVDRRNSGGYLIRILKGERRRGGQVSVDYDYFETDADGTVEIAPRGYARDFKPGRITGLDAAVAKYAAEVSNR